MTRPVLLLVESNTTGTGRQFARRSAALGIEPVLVTTDPSRYPYATEDGLRTELADTSDDRAVLDTARRLGRRTRLAGVLSSSEYYVATAAATAHALGLPGPDANAVRGCRNKVRQRQLLVEGAVPVPDFAVARDAGEAVLAAERIGHPVVLKPAQGSGSLGVRLCADPAAVAAHAAALTAAKVNERGLAASGEILVEEYLSGAEYSVEVFGHEAVVVVTKRLGPLPDFLEMGHDLPAVLPPPAEGRLKEVAVRAVKALGLGWGAAHVELRMDGDDVRVIEVNPRLAGGMIPELVRRALAVDLVHDQVALAAGLTPEGRPSGLSRSAAIRFLTAHRSGTLAGAPVLSAALEAGRTTPGVVAAVLHRGPGERVAPAQDFRGRIGHVIAVADEMATAAISAENGLAHLAAVLDQQKGPDHP